MDSGRLEAVPSGAVHLDTVRALHQTVVSLRTALEVSKNSLKELKEKYERHSHCLDYADVIERLSIENHILRRKVIDLGLEHKNPTTPDIKLEVTYSPRSQSDCPASEVVIETATDVRSAQSVSDIDSPKPCSDTVSPTLDPAASEEISKFSSTENLNNFPIVGEQVLDKPESDASDGVFEPEENQNFYEPEDTQNIETEDLSQIISSTNKHQPSFKTKLELLSKFDVRIKVRTLKEGEVVSNSTSDSDSTDRRKDSDSSIQSFKFEDKRKHFETKEDLKGREICLKTEAKENLKMAVPNEGDPKSKTDNFDVQVKITSEENLVVKENYERSRKRDTLNLDVDDLSFRSMSEGDNSVFSEGAMTPLEQVEEKQEGSGNESEVDDIELIFTTHESKDMSMNLQEDLVSIRESEATDWTPKSASTHSTPVLIKFHTLDPDQEQSGTPDSLKKRVSLPSDKEIRHVAFDKEKENLDLPGRGILKSYNVSDNSLYRKGTSRIDSVDSLSDYNRLSFDNKSCSFEMGSSVDMRSDFNLGHRFSVFAERDISKCGTSEDDLALNLNVRRNTCPNPFQYRPLYRGVSRPPGPFKAPLLSRGRPVLRDPSYPRRENAAQTDLSALPNRWSSDGYLAHNQMSLATTSAAPTLPGRSTTRRAPRPAPPPLRRTDETRRVLLSDIGFTSMVPELSRSADPVWALAKKQLSDETITNSTSRYLSRGSSYRSPPCLSADSEWAAHHFYMPPLNMGYRPWRSSLPDVRRDDTDALLEEAEMFVRRSIDNLHTESEVEAPVQIGQPYIPAGPKQLRLGHMVKIITPQGRIAVGRVRYVGLAGDTASSSTLMVGVEFPIATHPSLARNDGTHRGRRYFLAPPASTAVFVPFSKVVMAWAN